MQIFPRWRPLGCTLLFWGSLTYYLYQFSDISINSLTWGLSVFLSLFLAALVPQCHQLVGQAQHKPGTLRASASEGINIWWIRNPSTDPEGSIKRQGFNNSKSVLHKDQVGIVSINRKGHSFESRLYLPQRITIYQLK